MPHFGMERMVIYTSKKKSFLLLVGSIVFVTIGILMIIYADETTTYRYKSPLMIRITGIVGVLFFGLGILGALKRLIRTEVALIIDHNGINLNPKKPVIVEWKNIIGFKEIDIRNQRILIIGVNNPEYWIETETNIIRKKLMRFNLNNYESPFNVASVGLEISHRELCEALSVYFKEYKNEA